MPTPNPKFTTKVIKLNSFLFQSRGFFREDGFTWDWSYFCDRSILDDLKLEVEKGADGSTSLRFKYRTAADGVAFHYRVALDQTPSCNGPRTWFLCPYLGADGQPCGGRVRYLYLRRGQGVFGCERCAGLQRERNQRSRNFLFRDFLWPAQKLQDAMIQLLRCRSPKRKAFLREKIRTYREKIAAFSDTWIKIAARILTGRAGVRDTQRFNELLSRLLGPEMGVFPNDDLEDRSGRNAANNTMTLSALLDDLEEGFRELLKTPYSEVFREATTDPQRQPTLALAAIVTRRISRHHKWSSEDDENARALEFAGNPVYLRHLQQDPEEFLKHFHAAYRKEQELVQRTLSRLSA